MHKSAKFKSRAQFKKEVHHIRVHCLAKAVFAVLVKDHGYLIKNAWVCGPSGYKDCWLGTELV